MFSYGGYMCGYCGRWVSPGLLHSCTAPSPALPTVTPPAPAVVTGANAVTRCARCGKQLRTSYQQWVDFGYTLAVEPHTCEDQQETITVTMRLCVEWPEQKDTAHTPAWRRRWSTDAV